MIAPVYSSISIHIITDSPPRSQASSITPSRYSSMSTGFDIWIFWIFCVRCAAPQRFCGMKEATNNHPCLPSDVIIRSQRPQNEQTKRGKRSYLLFYIHAAQAYGIWHCCSALNKAPSCRGGACGSSPVGILFCSERHRPGMDAGLNCRASSTWGRAIPRASKQETARERESGIYDYEEQVSWGKQTRAATSKCCIHRVKPRQHPHRVTVNELPRVVTRGW